MAKPAARKRLLVAVPDALDLRDRPYQPALHNVPTSLDPRPWVPGKPPIRDQGDTSACTGFALAAVIEHLLRISEREVAAEISPYMLYHNARKYDEFPGSGDTGSSLRGCLKGWYKHGACALNLWDAVKRPRLPPDPTNDWWRDGVRRPLGAYYRIDVKSITDMHVAIAETGAIYASAACHSGWDTGNGLPEEQALDWTIPSAVARDQDGGHAFAIVGYDDTGFILQNSWGTGWGSGGYARLEYRDWLDNAMDCWVAQLGVPTRERQEVAQSTTLRSSAKGAAVRLAASTNLRIHEIKPFIINVENNGRLSDSGQFHTDDEDLEDLVGHHLDKARAAWGIPQNKVVDVAIYAHGGMTNEDTAAGTAATWIPKLYERRIFPVFIMWETGLLKTLRNIFEDIVRDWLPGDAAGRRTGGFWDAVGEFKDERIEGLLARPGSAVWQEMKENARLISANASKQGCLKALVNAMAGLDPKTLRLHVVGHSAGAIATIHVINKMIGYGWKFETVQYLAPAATVELFTEELLPHISSGKVNRYTQFHLDDRTERSDKTVRAALGYGKSILYLVANAFEGGVRTPISGLQVDFEANAKIKQVRTKVGSRLETVVAPKHSGAARSQSGATEHGGFDNDPATIEAVIQRMKQ